MRIAVTGASGRIGGAVLALLSEHGEEHDLVAVSRRPPTGLSEQVRHARGDYGDISSLRTAFADVDTLVFVSSDGPAVDLLVHHANVVRAAQDTGVQHIVALSGLDSDVHSPFCYGVTYGHTERLLGDVRCDVSICRTSIFTEFFAGFLSTARTRGELRLPGGDGRISLVSVDDVAAGLAALATRGPAPCPPPGIVELTGPESLSLRRIAEIATRTWHIPIVYTDIEPEAFLQDLASERVEPWWCYAFCSMFASVREHRWDSVTGSVLELTGRAPRSVADVLAD